MKKKIAMSLPWLRKFARQFVLIKDIYIDFQGVHNELHVRLKLILHLYIAVAFNVI